MGLSDAFKVHMLLFRICAKYNLHLRVEPTYGGRGYLEKQEEMLTTVTMKTSGVESPVEEEADTACEKACGVVVDTVRAET